MTRAEQLEQALRQEHAAGNHENARLLAQQLQVARTQQTPPTTPRQTPKQPELLVSKVLEMAGVPRFNLPKHTEGAANAFGDAALFGWGNEYSSAIDALKSDRPFSEVYGASMDQRLDSRNAFMDERPKTALATSVGGGLVAGGVLNPKRLSTLFALGASEGAGGMEENRPLGGFLGGVMAPAANLSMTLASKIPSIWRGAKRMLYGDPEMSAKKAKDAAVNFTANNMKRLNITEKELSELKALPDDTFLDAVVTGTQRGEGMMPLAETAVSVTDDTAAVAAPYITKNANPMSLADTLRNKLGVGSSARKAAIEYTDNIEKTRKAVGKQMDQRLVATSGQKVNTQDKIYQFLERGPNKKYLREAVDQLEAEDLPVTKNSAEGIEEILSSGEGVREALEDLDPYEIDDLLVDRIRKVLKRSVESTKGTEMQPAGPRHAHYQTLLNQFDEITERQIKDPEMSALRSQYATLRQQERAFKAGYDKFDADKPTEIMRTTRFMSDEAREAYREGVTNNLADKPDQLADLLTSQAGKDKIALVFGDKHADLAKGITDKEITKGSISDRLKQAVNKQAGAVARQTSQGQREGVKNLFKRLEGKRAYSAVGGMWLGANEILDSIMKADLPDQVFFEMAKILTTTGDDATKLLQRIATVEMPAITKSKIRQQIAKHVKTASMGAVGASAPATAEALTTPPEHLQDERF